jgi:ketosteroid isomerase-like protein
VSPLDELIPDFNAAFDALERGDLDAFTEVTAPQTHPECTFRSGIGSAVSGTTYEGIDGIRSWFGDLIATTTERRWRDRRYETHDDRLLLFLAEFEFTGAASGAVVRSEVGSVFEYESGLCVRITSFTSIADARAFAEARVA